MIFPDFHVSKTLAPFAKTTLEFTPDKAGQFGFACGMNMLHGTLIVEEGKEVGEPAEVSVPQRGDVHTHEHALAVGVGPTMQVGKTEEVEFAILGRGVTCPTCVTNIEKVLKDLPGMDEVHVNCGAERRDLTRRLIVGAILTAPVVFAMMAHEFFDPKNAVATEEYQGKTYHFRSAPLGLDPPPMNRCR